MNDSDNVRNFPSAKTQPSEIGGGNGGSNYGERIARIEERLNHTATREDIADVKTLIANLEARIAERETKTLRWVIGVGITLIVALVAALVGLIMMLIKIFVIPAVG